MNDVSEKGIKKHLSADVIIACEDLDINPIFWFMHFGNINPYHAECKMCNDYLSSLCHVVTGDADDVSDFFEGSSNTPIDCFKGKKCDVEFSEGWEW